MSQTSNIYEIASQAQGNVTASNNNNINNNNNNNSNNNYVNVNFNINNPFGCSNVNVNNVQTTPVNPPSLTSCTSFGERVIFLRKNLKSLTEKVEVLKRIFFFQFFILIFS